MKRYLLVLLCVIISAQLFAAESAIPVIRRYVTQTRHWQPSAYRIERREREGRYIIYYVVAFADEHPRTLVAGAGQSFAVYYDPRAQRIVREMLSSDPSNQALQPTPLPAALLFLMSYPRIMKPRPQRRG